MGKESLPHTQVHTLSCSRTLSHTRAHTLNTHCADKRPLITQQMDAPLITGQPFYKLAIMRSQRGVEVLHGPKAVWLWRAEGLCACVCVCASVRKAEKCSHAALPNERAGQPLNGH